MIFQSWPIIFLRVNVESYGKGPMKISTHAIEKLSNHNWPGNVRELQHAIEKAVIMADSPLLKPSDFSFSPSHRNIFHSELTLEEMEKKMITESLRRYNDNISIVSEKLGITRQTLYNKMKKFDL